MFLIPATEIVDVTMQELARQLFLEDGANGQVSQLGWLIAERSLIRQR